MTDEDLRELERCFRASGDLGDESAWISARIRAGALPRERVELAAWLGDPAALAAVGRVTAAPPIAASEVLDAAIGPVYRRAWLPALEVLCGLAGWGAEPCARALIELVGRADEAVILVEASLACPCALHAAMNAAAADVHEAQVEGSGVYTVEPEVMAWVQRALAATTPGGWTRAACSGLQALMVTIGRGAEGVDMTPVRAPLASWALGRGDPIRERVHAHLARAERDLEGDARAAERAAYVAGCLGPLAVHLAPRLERLASTSPAAWTRERATQALELVRGRFTPPTPDDLRQLREMAAERR